MDLTKTPAQVWRGNSSAHQPNPDDATLLAEEQNAAIEATEGSVAAQAASVAAIDDRVTTVESDVTDLQSTVVSGLINRDPVAAWAGTNITLSGAQTVDGVTLSNGDRVGAGAQTDPSENGVRIYNDAGAWTRATDMDDAADINLSAVLVEGGATYGGDVWKFTVADPGTFVLDTDDITATKVQDAAAIKDYLDAQIATKAGQAEFDALKASLGTASTEDADAFASSSLLRQVALATMRATLGRMTGEGGAASLTIIPRLVDMEGYVIESVAVLNGTVVEPVVLENTLSDMRRTLGFMEGGGDGSLIPRRVDASGYVVTTVEADPGPNAGTAYVIDGALYVSTGSGIRLLDDHEDRTWISAQVFGAGVIGTYTQDSIPVSVQVALSDGSIWLFGGYRIWTNDGQSNAEGTANDDRSIVFPGALEFAHRPSMLMTAAKDVWLGMATSGGASVELASDAITGVTDLVDTISAADKHGTISVSAAARAHAAAGHAAFGDWVPNILAWSNAEGGEFIASMLDGAPAGEYYAANMTTVLTSIADLSISAVYDWMLMQQGESDPATPTLGVNHNLLRAQTQAKAQAILGQQTPVRMVSTQASSFYNSSAGCRSILDEALADTDGVFFCTGPSYIFPWSDYDFLHNTSVGHAMRGEMEQAAIYRIEQGLGWLPLHMVSASFTGANEVTVTLSEDAESVTGWLVDEAGLANSGIALVGATVSGVAVAGDELIITTSDAASGATAVQAAMVGHGAGPRAQATIPRSTIRAVEQTGTFLTGAPMHKPLCHQEISIG
ncbi:hypothetical protein [Pseudooceanicola algae]|uniref:Sialate O-acetylesterase domain-containing protein n=1 Tax=Pseudooceanicola algae TaxID=1537215 RepID=A0A7T1BRZ4_9RHOB|nr:hypothetical protein [Pseudooceanicola algae]QPM89390.1 hypothetical protein PSAL_006060 [Pseudooceanicola algae]